MSETAPIGRASGTVVGAAGTVVGAHGCAPYPVIQAGRAGARPAPTWAATIWRASAHAATLGVFAAGLAALAVADRLAVVLALLALATALDGLDGWLARRAGGPTLSGAVLDLLADFTAFGLAPIVALLRNGLQPGLPLWAALGLFLGAAVYRLLRSCRLYARKHPVGYVGLPMPAAGWLLLGLGLSLRHDGLLALAVLSVGALAVSRRPYPSPQTLWRRLPGPTLFGLLLSGPLALLAWRYGLLLAAGIYAVYPLLRRLDGRERESGAHPG